LLNQEIVERSIEDDQQFVAEQLVKTFKDQPAANLACTTTKLTLACVAKGDFKTSSSLLKDKTLRAPNNTFTISDYLSHASRLIFDYKGLSADHKNEFLA